MSTYAIGDIQGCYASLQRLLASIDFDGARDQLWLVGDLVSRGPDSLAVLRWAREFSDRIQCVLGNHDLHLLAAGRGIRTAKDPGLQAILDAPDRGSLLHWLTQQPLLHEDSGLGYLMVHAGLPPHWTLEQCRLQANFTWNALQADPKGFLEAMYGDGPGQWSEAQTEADRHRFIVNHFTRLRMCDRRGAPVLAWKGARKDAPADLISWFEYPGRPTASQRILFGHWSALEQIAWPQENVWCLDTGCVWGQGLTAMRLEDQQIFQVDACASDVRRET